MPKLKVRIAVAVDPSTLDWNSCGWGGRKTEPSDKDKMIIAVDTLNSGEQRYFIEAELDVNPPAVVAGSVIDA